MHLVYVHERLARGDSLPAFNPFARNDAPEIEIGVVSATDGGCFSLLVAPSRYRSRTPTTTMTATAASRTAQPMNPSR